MKISRSLYPTVLPLLILAGLSLLGPDPALAVPARPQAIQLMQPDGEVITLQKWGNENHHGYESRSGKSVVQDPISREWRYAIANWNNQATSSAVRVRSDDLENTVSQGFEPHLERQLTRIRQVEQRLLAQSAFQQVAPASKQLSQETAQRLPPSIGSGMLPVMLINYSDTPWTYSAAQFNSLLFGTNTYSMADYYRENSYGQFTVSGGPGGIAGPYVAANSHNYYGGNDSSGNDSWPGDLVYEAVMAADNAGYNFAPYDQDGDCAVDVVGIVHQGNGEEASPTAADMWSHRWSLTSAQAYGNSHYGAYTTNDTCTADPSRRVRVNDYIMQPEKLDSGMTTMGVFAHEYGHSFGLPDLYDTDGSSNGIGDWSLMASGSWNFDVIDPSSRPGDRPPHFDAWSKYFLGWVTPTLVSGTLSNEPIVAANTAADVYQFRNGSPSAGGEYFLVENRQQAGFDVGLPGHGLMIWHIDESKATRNNTDNSRECYPGGPACSTQHFRVAAVQADNLWELEKNIDQGDRGDPFPGSTNNTRYTQASSPNSLLYSGSNSFVSITGISASSPTMTATLSDESTPSYSLSVNKSGSGSGTVTSSPAGISCGSTCSASYSSGTTLSLTATAAAGFTFTGWSGDCSGAGNPCTVSMTAARTVTASFSASGSTLSISTSGSGSGSGSGTVTSNPAGITCGVTCSASFGAATPVTLTATPAAGFAFAGWSGACEGMQSCTLSLSSNTSALARFNPAVSLSGQLNGDITVPAGTTTYTNVGYNTAGIPNTLNVLVGIRSTNVQVTYPGFFNDTVNSKHELIGSIKVQGYAREYVGTSYYGLVTLAHKTSGQIIQFQVTRPAPGPNSSGINVEFLDGAIGFTSHLTPPLPELPNGRWTMWMTKGGIGTAEWGTVPAVQFSATAIDLLQAYANGALNTQVTSASVNWIP
jgi:M6 family metalloprotease-like protein/uncharacterized repeat protein (TIGR02543 family)